MKNTRATGLAVMAAYISCIVCVLADGFEEAALKRGSSFMRLSKPRVRAEIETIQNALDKASKVGSVAMWLTVCEAVMIPRTIMKNIMAIVVPRPFSPESSEANEK